LPCFDKIKNSLAPLTGLGLIEAVKKIMIDYAFIYNIRQCQIELRSVEKIYRKKKSASLHQFVLAHGPKVKCTCNWT